MAFGNLWRALNAAFPTVWDEEDLFTDLHGTFPGPQDDPGCPVLWVCWDKSRVHQPVPFGTVILAKP